MPEIASLTVSISKLRHYTVTGPLFLNILDPPLNIDHATFRLPTSSFFINVLIWGPNGVFCE